MQNIHCFSVLTLSATNASLAPEPMSDSPAWRAWRSIYYCCLSLLQVAVVPHFGLLYTSFFAFKLSGYTHFACLDKNDFSRHKKNGSLKSEYQYLIWDLDLIRFEALCFLLDRDVLFGLTGCRDTRFSRVMHFSGQNPSQVGMDFAWLGLQGSAPSPVEGRNIPLASYGCFGRCLGWDPMRAPWVEVWGSAGGAVMLPAPSAQLPVCVSGRPCCHGEAVGTVCLACLTFFLARSKGISPAVKSWLPPLLG